MRALFRTDASPEVGIGHAVRCLALAQTLSSYGWECRFVCTPESFWTVPALATAWDPIQLAEPQVDWLVELLNRQGIRSDVLIVDHYGLGLEFERRLRSVAARIVVIDDRPCRPHDCEVLIDGTADRAASDYAGFVPPACTLLVGSPYALLRPDFAERRSRVWARRKGRTGCRRLLVSFGGTDPHNVTSLVLRAVQMAELEAEVDVVLGRTAPHLEAVGRLVTRMKQKVQLHVEAVNMAGLMAEADLAVGGAGTSSWERCCSGLPALVVVMAENQEDVARALARRGAAAILGWHRDLEVAQVARAIAALSADSVRLASMGERAAALCDGRGSVRVVPALLTPEYARDGLPVRIRAAELEDGDLMLTWQRHERTRRFARNPRPPSDLEHRDWLGRSLGNPDRVLTMLLYGDQPAGVLRLDRLDRGSAFEVSILVDPGKSRLGIATAGLALARKLLPRAELRAVVLDGNEPSHLLFRAAGYSRKDSGLYVSLPVPREDA